MRKILKVENGFTLVEIIAAITILGILALTFFNLFGSSMLHILSSGKKDEAITLAANKMESIYNQQISTEDDIKTILNDGYYIEECEDMDSLYAKPNSDLYRYCIDGDSDGFEVTIVCFYQEGEHNISLTSFFRKE